MSDNGKTYGVVEGQVQFDPKRERQVNGQTVCDVTIKATNIKDPATGEQKLVSITIWPEFGQVYEQIKKGDWVSVDGEIRVNMGQDATGAPKQYISWNANAIAWVSAFVRPPRQVMQAPQGFAPVPVQAATVAVAPVAAPVQPIYADQSVTTVTAPAPVAPVAAPTPSLF